MDEEGGFRFLDVSGKGRHVEIFDVDAAGQWTLMEDLPALSFAVKRSALLPFSYIQSGSTTTYNLGTSLAETNATKQVVSIGILL